MLQQTLSPGLSIEAIDEGTRTLMRKEKDELNVYARSHIGLFVNWFLYYCAVNAVGMGWLAAREGASPFAYVMIITTFYQVVSASALVGCVVVLQHFKELRRRESAIVAALNEAGTNATIPRDYERVVLLLTVGCITVLAAWFSFFLLTVRT